MLIQNLYHKKLAFSINGKPFGIEKHEIKTVDKEIGIQLLRNHWIVEVEAISESEICSCVVPKKISQPEEIPNESSSSSSSISIIKEKSQKLREKKGRPNQAKTK